MKQAILGIFILICIVVGALIDICQFFFPFFMAMAILSIIALLVYIVLSLLFDNWSLVMGAIIIAILCFSILGAVITYEIGFNFGESKTGRDIQEVADTFKLKDEAEKNVTLLLIDTFKNVSEDLLDDSSLDDNTKEIALLPFEVMEAKVR